MGAKGRDDGNSVNGVGVGEGRNKSTGPFALIFFSYGKQPPINLTVVH